MKLELMTADVEKIQPFLEEILADGGKEKYNISAVISGFRNVEGYSGFEYQHDGTTATIGMGLILGGTGYILKRILHHAGEIHQRYDYFNVNGVYTFTSDKEALRPVIVDFHVMDLTCPVLNHFYNYLSLEYKNAGEGRSETKLVHSVESFLRYMYKSKQVQLDIEQGTNDPAVLNIYNTILNSEMDPVLTWEERQIVFKNHKNELKKILSTKLRAHRLSKLIFRMGLLRKDIAGFLSRLIARPGNNLYGITYRYTIGKVIWFFQTVKNNLGYSIALAVYGPFTYYFITMPMNPHAMQAVGKVRATYLEAKQEVIRILDKSEIVISDLKSTEALASETKVVADVIKTSASAPKQQTKKTNQNSNLNNTISSSDVTTGKSELNRILLGDEKTEKTSAKYLNMLLTTDLPQANKVSWSERMSNFKQMQIAYEENIEYASRMGRLEQLETQYNFPMQIEATWEELERYNKTIFKIRAENPSLSTKMKQYLINEINRTQQLQLYLWDRMGRFILDQIYVMLDQDKEQKRNDYYVGRSFVFMEEMTNILSWRYKDLKKPKGYEKIRALAHTYSTARKETGKVLANLRLNSDLFKQKDLYDTKEFRSHMKRQWEILFLQNAKAEEASNMGLNMYNWSIRNAVWVLQSFYSAKREELALLIKRDVLNKALTPDEMLTRSKISIFYETFLHNLTLEYVGIREEIMNRLGKDVESAQRMIVIKNLQEFLSDRQKLDNFGMSSHKKTAGTKI